MPDCGLNLPCTQQVSINNQQTSALEISNAGPAGGALWGKNTESPDPAVIGETGGGAGSVLGVGVRGILTGSSVSGGNKIVGVQGVCTGIPFGTGHVPIGVEGQADEFGIGVSGINVSSGTGVAGSSVEGNGVTGSCGPGQLPGPTQTGDGVVGLCAGPVDTSGLTGNGVVGVSNAANGVTGTSYTSFASGVLGVNTVDDTDPRFRYGVAGVGGSGSNSIGVMGSSGNAGYSGYFTGKVRIVSIVNNARSGFQIDHPLEPHAKYLNHSAVESSDMKNVYDGVVTLDFQGSAWVELPGWFEALNRDFRYQLTPIGSYAPAYVAQEIVNNRFQIAGEKPGQRISWLVTGIRRDAWAEKNPIAVEEDKDHADQGKLLHPLEAGHPREMGISYSRTRALQSMAEQRARVEREEQVRSGGKQ